MDWEITLKVLDVLKWPLVAVFALLLFRFPIRSFLTRLRSAGKDGLTIDPINDPPPQEQKRASQLIEFFRNTDPESFKEIQLGIRQEFEEIRFAKESEKVEALIRQLALTKLFLNFEMIYRLIFGSQIFLLRRANENRFSGLSDGSIESHFSDVQKFHPQIFENWKLETYMAFFFSQKLLLHANGHYYIMNFGVDFLQWIVMAGLPENKPF